MRFPERLCAAVAAASALVFSVAAGAYAQATPSSAANNSTYIAIDPLAGVRYDNRYDLSLGMAYDHMKAGPTLLQGANLGGLDLSGSYWFSKYFGAESSIRYYLGTSGAAPNTYNIDGPFVSEIFFTAGPEWLGPHNKHGDLMAHVLVGGVSGNFQKDLRGEPPSVVGFYNDQVAPAMIVGGHMDLNRSARWVFRITPDAVMTRYSTNYGNKITQTDVNFAISVGVEYKFKKRR
ncbi:MAG: hypothetical protein ACP5FH_00700 [Terracidiphilus sp.]